MCPSSPQHQVKDSAVLVKLFLKYVPRSSYLALGINVSLFVTTILLEVSTVASLYPICPLIALNLFSSLHPMKRVSLEMISYCANQYTLWPSRSLSLFLCVSISRLRRLNHQFEALAPEALHFLCRIRTWETGELIIGKYVRWRHGVFLALDKL